jgi:taurine dioxygenase
LFEVIPTGHALGAEVWNVDVTSFDDWSFAALMRALLKHQVLLVRGQTLGEPDLAAFRRRLGQVSVRFTSQAATFGAESSFSSLYAIYDALPPALRKRIAHLKVRHPADAGSVRPLVCIHPDTGRSMLHLGERRGASLVGVEPEDADALLEELWQFASEPGFAWHMTCRPGDLVIWDPRCTLVQPTMPNAPHPRLLHRAEIWTSLSVA